MKEIKYQGKYLTLSEEVIGGETYERVALGSGVKILPIRENKLFLIKEDRAHENKPRWKCIGGWMDKDGKSELETAQEELNEEGDMEGGEWHELHVHDTHGATVGTRSTGFVVLDPVDAADSLENPDQDEILETRWVTLTQLFEMIDNNELWWDADTMLCVQALRLYGEAK